MGNGSIRWRGCFEGFSDVMVLVGFGRLGWLLLVQLVVAKCE